MGKALSLEQILPALRALIASELVRAEHYSRKEAATILKLTPAAITQYLKGYRAGGLVRRIGTSKKLRLIVSTTTKEIADDYRKDGRVASITILLDAAYQILAMLSGEITGEPVEKVPTSTEDSKEWVGILRKRLQAEQVAAQRSMGLAIWAKNELARSIFRQIASDSLRHADIVSTIISHLERGDKTVRFESPSKEELQELLEGEEGASEPSIRKIKKMGDPAVRLLIESVEADEIKHLRLLQGFLAIQSS